MQVLQTATSHCLVIDAEGNNLGSIVRQKGSTLWAFYKEGYTKPFKKDIPTLSAAKDLAKRHPAVWYGSMKGDMSKAFSYFFWTLFLVSGTLTMLSLA